MKSLRLFCGGFALAHGRDGEGAPKEKAGR
jgi:hypothetical protein